MAALGLLLALVPLRLATGGALELQILAATAGAVMVTSGAALMRASWPRKRHSDLHYLLAALGFFLVCAGAVAMLAGAGLYH